MLSNLSVELPSAVPIDERSRSNVSLEIKALSMSEIGRAHV